MNKVFNLFYIYIFLFAVVLPLYSQQETDPLTGRENLSGSNEFIMVWGQLPDGGTSGKSSYQKIYDYLKPLNNVDHFPIDERVIVNPRFEESGDNRVAFSEQVDVATGDFNEDGFADAVGAWQGPDSTITIWVPQIDRISLTWEESTILESEYKLFSRISWASGHFRLASGDFDGDREDEFVLVYHATDEKIHIEVFDTDSTHIPRRVGSYIDEDLLAELDHRMALDIAVADFNLDGRDELLLTSIDADGGSAELWAIYAKIFELHDGSAYELITKTKKIVMEEPVHETIDVGAVNLAVTTGDINLDTVDEIALLFSFYNRDDDSNENDTFFFLMKVSEDLSSIDIPLPEGSASRKNNGGEIEALSIAAGDVNGDGSDEIVYLIDSDFYIYGADSLLHPNYKMQDGGNSGQDDYYSNRFIAVGDMDQNGRAEIIIVRNTDKEDIQQFKITVFEVNRYFSNMQVKAERLEEEPAQGSSRNNRSRNFAIAVGDFDGDRTYLGAPKRYFEYGISQPLVILNSPPVHFDILDETVYDVNTCYNGNDCGHNISYAKETSGTVRISSTISRDWVADTTNTDGGGAYGNRIDSSMHTSYGEGFARSRNNSEEFSISFSAEAVTEDLIFGTVTDYVIWEYPVFADDTLRGYVAVVDPMGPVKTWFSTESWPGQSYIPNHEVGNILSYREYNNLTSNDYLSEAIKLDSGIRFGLSPTSSYEWELNWNSWQESEAADYKVIGSEVTKSSSYGLEIDFYGSLGGKVGEETRGNYAETKLNTYSSAVAEDIDVKVVLGNVADSEKRYDVTPYAYWANNGALVVDYAARPQLAPAGQPETWWQQNYGHNPDPAFILPFRYHPEKGLNLSEDAKRNLTNDIQFFPSKAAAGDTVVIVARIHNYSLIDTDLPVKVKFYIGDPDQGGELITGVDGENEVSTETFLQYRTSALVKMVWEVPETITNFSRIYAVIDPDDDVSSEIHDNNNKGYNVLGSDFATEIEEEQPGQVPARFELLQNYPNPFNPSTSIEYVLPERIDVSLKVYNVLGQLINTLVDGPQAVGKHKINFNANKLASGIYIYRLSAKGISMSRRMILIK